MKQNKSDVTDIVCEFHAFQNCAENRMVKLKVAEVMEKVTNCYQGRMITHELKSVWKSTVTNCLF